MCRKICYDKKEKIFKDGKINEKIFSITFSFSTKYVNVSWMRFKNSDNDELVVYFVPSRDPAEIQKATKPLAEMLKAELSKLGYDFEKVRIEVGTSFEAVGEALSSGTAQVGFIPGGTYVLYDDGVDVALTATRFGLNHDSENPADWNTAPTENTNNKVKYYRSLVIAGPSEKGQKLAAKINNGEKLTLDDIQGATWEFHQIQLHQQDIFIQAFGYKRTLEYQ